MLIDVVSLIPEGLVRHLPVLVILFPLMLAPISAAMPNWRLSWALAQFSISLAFVFCLALYQLVSEQDVVRYALGGWAPPLGIEFVVDRMNIPFLLLISFIGTLATIFALPTIVKDIQEEKRSLFFTAFMMCVGGLLGMAVTGDAFNLFVFLEVSSISTYVMVALGASRDRRALPAAFNYLVMGSIGATFYVIGIGFLYSATGTLNMADLAERLPEVMTSKTVHAGFAFIVVGLALKAAIFPLHQWLPNAYAYAPTFVTVFLSATATKAAFYALIRLSFSVFSPDLYFQEVIFFWVLAPLGAIAAIVASFQAIFQTDIRRMLAYSSVAQVGYMVIGLSLLSPQGLSASLFHLMNHALMKGALFMAVGGVFLTLGSTKMKDLAGVARRAPWTMTALGVSSLSLIGVPLTAGFMSKVALFQAALLQGAWWMVVVLGISSVLAVLYVGRILETAFFKTPGPAQAKVTEAPLTLLVPLWILAFLNIYFGLDSSFITGLTDGAASVAFAGGQP